MKPEDVRRVLRLLERPRRKLAFWLTGGVALGGLEMATLGLLLLAVSAIVGGSTTATGVTDRIIGMFGGRRPFLSIALGALFVAATARFALFMYMERRNQRIAFQLASRLQKTVFSRLLEAPYPFFYSHKHGALTNAVCSLPLRAFLGAFFLPRAILSFSTALFTGLFMFVLSPTVFAVAAVFAAGYFYAVRKLVEQAVFQTNVERNEALQRQSEAVSEAMSGVRQIRVFAGEERANAELGVQADRYAVNTARETFIRMVPSQTVQFLFVAVLALVLWVTNRSMSPEQFLKLAPLFVTYVYGAMRIMPSTSQSIEAVLNVSASLPHVRALEEWLEIPPDPLGTQGDVAIRTIREGITLHDVGFRFGEGDWVLRHLDLTIPARKVTAVVGPSGVGKSTLIDLILKFLAPTEGRITVDGRVDLADVDRCEWFGIVGFVSQDTFLFHTSIRNNLLYSDPDADDEAIARACRQAGIWEFIESLPEGLDTEIGDRGVTLSGGQRQRLAIARALVRGPQLLIFDEATNALDEATETRVMDMVYELAEHATIVLIAHRLSTVQRADLVVALQPDLEARAGSFAELSAAGLIPSGETRRARAAADLTSAGSAGTVTVQDVNSMGEG